MLTLPTDNKQKNLPGFYLLVCAVTLLHFGVTFVVTLFILSTLNILNQRIFHFDKLDSLEIMLTAVVFLISIAVYFRSFHKITLFIKDTFYRGSS